MSIHYDLYKSANPLKREGEQPLHARIVPSVTLDAKKFIEFVSKSNGFSLATIESCLQAITNELQHWLKQGWIIEVGELGHFSLSLKCDHAVMDRKEIRSSSINLNKISLRLNRNFRKGLELLQLERIESPYRTNSIQDKNKYNNALMQHLKEQGCITRADFMRLAGISRDKAIDLLKEYIKEGIIRKYGGGKTVVY